MPAATLSAPQTLIDVLTHAATSAGCMNALRCRETLQEAADKRQGMIDTLLDAKLVEEEAFFEQLGNMIGVPFLPDGAIDPVEGGLHNKFPAKLALRHRLYPIAVSGMDVTVLTYDPFNLDARQAVGQELRKRVHWQIASRHRVLEALHQGYGVGAENFEELLEGREDLSGDEMSQEVNVLDEADEEATVMNFVNQIFREALRERATDIHVEPLERDLRIRYRIDGRLLEVPVPPNMRLLQNSLISRLKIMAHLDIAERRLPQDGRINLELDGDPIDVRVATIPSVNGESVALRLLTRKTFDMAKIGLDAATEATIRKLIALPNGIILVTGPTGSGKSTTLYTLLRELNTKDRRIVTIEDPVENKLDGVVQIAVKSEIGLTFAAGLRSILRGDPNVIMVGEMRDQETVEIAIRGALTGHLVLSTLHTNDAVSGISRLLDMGIEPFLVSSSVRAFQAQRLVRTLCPSCKQPAHYEDSFLNSVGFPLELKGGLCTAVGCRNCRNTGFMGRLAIMEICVMTPALAEKINSNGNVAEMKTQAAKDGMIPMRQYGMHKAANGITTLEEVLTVTAAGE